MAKKSIMAQTQFKLVKLCFSFHFFLMILSLMFSTIIMRVENHVHIRHIMLYHFEKGHKAAEAFRDLNELFGEGTIGERQVRRWFERFKSGDTSLEDEGGRGRPSDFDDQALLDAVEEDESLTTQLSKPKDLARRTTLSSTMTTLGRMSKNE
jgi:hypothetical protein